MKLAPAMARSLSAGKAGAPVRAETSAYTGTNPALAEVSAIACVIVAPGASVGASRIGPPNAGEVSVTLKLVLSVPRLDRAKVRLTGRPGRAAAAPGLKLASKSWVMAARSCPARSVIKPHNAARSGPIWAGPIWPARLDASACRLTNAGRGGKPFWAAPSAFRALTRASRFTTLDGSPSSPAAAAATASRAATGAPPPRSDRL